MGRPLIFVMLIATACGRTSLDDSSRSVRPNEGWCGDGVVGPTEDCDDGNHLDIDACTTTCHAARCGDGFRQGFELCDDGNTNQTDACLTSCVPARCGDGVVREGVELCDGAPGPCTTRCTVPTCGDGKVEAPEQCDDGNFDDSDACLSTCLPAFCGDGVVWRGVEACDDANTASTEACLPSCKAARCGDGFVRGGVEECDDGNQDEGDACRSTCVEARCGDGILQRGVEACDDGNEDDTDGCLRGCVLPPACAGLQCTTPPAPVCLPPRTQRTFDAVGTCLANGKCTYVLHDTSCTWGCAAGACLEDPCTGVTCPAPEPTCLDASTLKTASGGRCLGGACSFDVTESQCPGAETCVAGACRSTDPSLSGLSVSPGVLAFSPTTTVYAVSVPVGTTSLQVTATVAQPGRATLDINGSPATSGTAVTVALPGRTTTILVLVTAESGATMTYRLVVTVPSATPGLTEQQAYVKASNTGWPDEFGTSVALSADGNTLAVGARSESSAATGVGGNQADNSADWSGAVYVFLRVGGTWRQEAYLKASNTGRGDNFGNAVALSADGSTLAVGAYCEFSAAMGPGGNQSDNSALLSGAVYIFVRSGGVWRQQEYLKASNTGPYDMFGRTVALSADGDTLAVSAESEDSAATGIGGNQADNSALNSGAVYVFARGGGSWSQQAYLKASNTSAEGLFGSGLALSADGATLAVGAWGDNGASTGVGGNQSNTSMRSSGATYIFGRSGAVWTQQAYVKASNPGVADGFGKGVALSADGLTLAVGAIGEDSSASGVGGNQADNSATNSGAVYVFVRGAGTWSQQAYLKASNTGADDVFGYSVALSADGNLLAVTARQEDSAATGLGGDQASNSAADSGAVYVFVRSAGGWTQQAYVKASNTERGDGFGVSLALSADGFTLAVGAPKEDSCATGLDRSQADNACRDSGAAYVFIR